MWALSRQVGVALFVVPCFVASTLAADTPAKSKPPQQPEPTAADVPYGKHPKQVVDFYQARSSKPTPGF